MIRDATDDELVAFHRGIYWDAFAAQHEPLAVWQAARRGEQPYEHRVRIAVDELGIAGGIVFERYPESGCGFLTYLVVAPRARGRGLGKQLVDGARAWLRDAPIVFAEANDPRTQTREPVGVAADRLRRLASWGARIVDARYVQPALAPGLARDPTLLLLAFDDRDALDGAIVHAFVDELYRATEGGPCELAFPSTVALRRA